MNEDKVLPGLDAHREQAVFCAVEIAHAFEFHHAFQRAIGAVGPTMIRTAEALGGAGGLGHNCGGMMAAHIEKSAQLAVLSAHDDKRLSRHFHGKELALLAHLVGSAHELPRCPKDALPLELRDARIEIPGRGDRPSPFEWVGRIVEIHDAAQAAVHARDLDAGPSTDYDCSGQSFLFGTAGAEGGS